MANPNPACLNAWMIAEAAMSTTQTPPEPSFLAGKRLVEPEATLTRIAPLLDDLGITRCADITGLDRLGIPVYSAIRPSGRLLQTSNGKGLRPIDAKVSALMEAVEHAHVESPSGTWQRASRAELQRQGHTVLAPDLLPHYHADVFYSDEYVIDWVMAVDLLSSATVYVPAGAVFIACSPMLYTFTTNGLASGNSLTEATLHALYELIERDTISRLSVAGRLRLTEDNSRFIDLSTIDDVAIAELHQKIARAGVKLVLIWIRSRVPIHTFWAVLLEENGFSHVSMVHFGYGTHHHPALAAIQAITEAAQSRLAFIQGVREDFSAKINAKHSNNQHRTVYQAFSRATSNASWSALPAGSSTDIDKNYACVLQDLRSIGHDRILRVDLTRSPYSIPVVKVLIPGLKMRSGLF
jgi:ribosomal protein S12 methylthiotransferase accessory factor